MRLDHESIEPVASQQELLALHGYVLDGANALAEAEKRLLTALGQATTLRDDHRGEEAHAMLTERVAMVRSALSELSAWLDGPQ
jgi:hypothetical protein